MKFISSHAIRPIDPDVSRLGDDTRRFYDPADRRAELVIRFKDSPYAGFFRAWLVMGIDDQYDVKCLVPIEETIRYSARTHGGTSTVHGSCLAIYDAFYHLPIDQRLELGTKFTVSIPATEAPHARAVFSEAIVPVDSIPSGIVPFNRRNLLPVIEPGESLSMQLRVGVVSNFSVRERTHWYHDGEAGLVIGTQLGRNPVAYLQTIVRQLNKRIDEAENNRLDRMLSKAGLMSQRSEVIAYIAGASREILDL